MINAQRSLWFSVAMLLPAALNIAGAAEIQEIDVSKKSDKYLVNSVTFMAAPIEDVFDVLADYDRFHRVSSTFVESRFLEKEANGNGVVYTVAKGCIAFFCRTLKRTEKLEVTAPTVITASVIPERSDLKFGVATWDLETVEGGTRVVYRMEMQPDFWMPPLIGAYLMKRSLSKVGGKAAQRIEDLALGNKSLTGVPSAQAPAEVARTHE